MSDTNILARLRGEYVALAGRGLPEAGTSNLKQVEAKVEVPDIGWVRITFERMTHKRGKNSHTWWAAKYAQASPEGR